MEDTRPQVQKQRQITCHGKRCSKSRILCQLPKLQLPQAKEVEGRERETFFFFFFFLTWNVSNSLPENLPSWNVSKEGSSFISSAWASKAGYSSGKLEQIVQETEEHHGELPPTTKSSYAIPNLVPNVTMKIPCAQLHVLEPVSSSPGSGSCGSRTT